MKFKKIICLISVFLLLLLAFSCIFLALLEFQSFCLNYKQILEIFKINENFDIMKQPYYLRTTLICAFVSLSSLFIFGLCVVGIIICVRFVVQKTNALNSVKYTYEEYKAERDRKKALKQEKQKEILKQKLNELEKGE